MRNLLQRVVLACALVGAPPAIAGAQDLTYVRTIPVAGYSFDVDWTNHDLYTADNQTIGRYDLATGAFETGWSAPDGALINDVAAGIGQVFVAAAGTRALYAYSSGGALLFQTDVNTRNRIGDVRGMVAAASGAYLVGNPGTILRISLNPFGYPQLVAGWGVVSNNNTGWETCSPSPSPPPYCYGSGYSGEELGKVTAAVDLAIRQNVENTGSFALFVLERRYLPGSSEPGYRVSIFSDEAVPTSFEPQGFLFGSLRGSGAGQLDDPYGIALDVERGRIYIADQGNNRVAVYAFQTGIFQRAFGWGVDTGANQLETCTPQSGCQKGLAAGPLYNPVRVQVDPSNGDVYVSTIGGISQFKNDVFTVTQPVSPDMLQFCGPVSLTGTGITPGSVLKLFLSTSSGPLDLVADGVSPTGTSTSTWSGNLPCPFPAPNQFALGQGFLGLQLVRTDAGYSSSNVVGIPLIGNEAQNVPSILAIGGTLMSTTSWEPSIGLANVEKVLLNDNSTVYRIDGTAFASSVINVFTASGNCGPLTPTAQTSTTIDFKVPVSCPAGPGSFQVVNATGNFRTSNAVSAPIGAAVNISSIEVNGSTVTVNGAGFSTLTVINLFASNGSTVENFGGFNGGTPKIPLDFVNSNQFTFTRPGGAVAGNAFVEAINPPFIPFSGSGNDPQGAFTLP